MVILKQNQKKAVKFEGEQVQQVGRPVKYPFYKLGVGDSFFAETYKKNITKCADNFKRSRVGTQFDIKDDTHVTRSGGEKKTLHGVSVTRVN